MSQPRKSVLGAPVNDPELDQLIANLTDTKPTEAELDKQRVSFVLGNSPRSSSVTHERAEEAVHSVLFR